MDSIYNEHILILILNLLNSPDSNISKIHGL